MKPISDSASAERSKGKNRGVGYDPYRPHRTTRLDYLLVAAAALVAAALVVWAIWG